MLCAGKERVAEDIFVLAGSPPWLAGDRCSHGMTALAHLPSHAPKPSSVWSTTQHHRAGKEASARPHCHRGTAGLCRALEPSQEASQSKGDRWQDTSEGWRTLPHAWGCSGRGRGQKGPGYGNISDYLTEPLHPHCRNKGLPCPGDVEAAGTPPRSVGGCLQQVCLLG